MLATKRLLLPAAMLVLALPIVPRPVAAGNGGVSGAALSPSRTQAASNQTVRVHYVESQTPCLRVVAAGVRTRNSSTPTAGGVITVPAGPTATNIVWAGLYWSILGNVPPPNAVTLNGNPVAPVGLPVTASPCWNEANAYPYFADVTALVVPGANAVAGLDDSGTLNTGPESEGASLVVIYRDNLSGACEIIVTDGNDLLTLPGQVWDNPLPVTCGVGASLPASLYFIGGDGQTAPTYAFSDDQIWNGVILGDRDDFDASDPATPGTAADLGWDTDLWGVATGGPNTASVASPDPVPPGFATGDCVNWIATVLEVGVHPSDVCRATPTRTTTWGHIKTLYR